MVNTELLEEAIKESGKKKGYLAKRCNLSRAGFRNCCINKAEFKGNHVNILCEELNITGIKRRLAIFYAQIGS